MPLLPTAMTFSRRCMYSQRASSVTRALFTEGMAGKGKRAARIRRPHHTPVEVDEFQFGQPEQIFGVVHTLARFRLLLGYGLWRYRKRRPLEANGTLYSFPCQGHRRR